MANSIALLLEEITESLNLPKRRHISEMISTLEMRIELLPKGCIDDYQRISNDIREFNAVWVIAKHGMPVVRCPFLTIHKDGELHEFRPERIQEIENGFTHVMTYLTKVANETRRLS